MTLSAGRVLAFLIIALRRVERFLINVMMDSTVGMDVNMDVKGRDLFGDFIEAVGRSRAISKCQGSRRHKNARNVGQRDKPRDAASCQASQTSKHNAPVYGVAYSRGTPSWRMPAWKPFCKTPRGALGGGSCQL